MPKAAARRRFSAIFAAYCGSSSIPAASTIVPSGNRQSARLAPRVLNSGCAGQAGSCSCSIP